MEKIECTGIPWIAMSITEPFGQATTRMNSILCDEAMTRDLAKSISILKKNLVTLLSTSPLHRPKQLPTFPILLSQFSQQNIQINSPP